MEGLGFLSGQAWSLARSVSADGSVVVGYSTGADREAFIWDAVHDMRSLRAVLGDDLGLDMSGWLFANVFSVYRVTRGWTSKSSSRGRASRCVLIASIRLAPSPDDDPMSTIRDALKKFLAETEAGGLTDNSGELTILDSLTLIGNWS